MASRAQLVEEVIAPALEAGKVVISDRYLLANIVYQGTAGGLLEEEIAMVGLIATAGFLPDLTIVLDIAPEEATARIGAPATGSRIARCSITSGCGPATWPPRRATASQGDAVAGRLVGLSGADRAGRCFGRFRHRFQADSTCGRTSPDQSRLNLAWQNLLGHDRVGRSLRTAVREGRLPHALFFAGPEGVGKLAFAASWPRRFFAKLGPEAALDPCLECPGLHTSRGGQSP